MTIAATYAQICSMAAGTTGITSAPAYLVDQITDDMLPYVMVVVGQATWNQHASGLYRQVRTYELRCFVKPVAQGASVDEGYSACLAPLYNLGRTFVMSNSLGGTVDQTNSQADTGVQKLTFADVDFHGFTLTLGVTEKAS